MSTQIKICGIRRPEDADYINACLPDYAGFIFWEKSFRCISLRQAVLLRERIDPRIQTVGVFVDETRETMLQYAASGAINVVQLHGHETDAEIDALKAALSGIPVWKAFRVRGEADLLRARASHADRVLLDNGYGTGVCFDHSLLDDFAGDYILAGGMTPENIPAAVARYHPAMIDISSGVETEGYKDADKIRRAVEAVRGGERPKPLEK